MQSTFIKALSNTIKNGCRKVARKWPFIPLCNYWIFPNLFYEKKRIQLLMSTSKIDITQNC